MITIEAGGKAGAVSNKGLIGIMNDMNMDGDAAGPGVNRSRRIGSRSSELAT